MSLDYDYIDGGGTRDTTNLYLFLYPHEDNGETQNEAEGPVADALATMGDRLVNANAIDRWEIRSWVGYTENESDIGDPDDDRGEPYFSDFDSWIGSNAQSIGVHLGVTSQSKYAEGEYVDGSYNAWNSKTVSFVGIQGGYSVGNDDQERYLNLSVQEPLHNMVVEDYYSSEDLTDGDEHDLGKLMPYSPWDTVGSSTPMITFYERSDTHPNREHDRSGKGQCTDDVDWDEYHERYLTSCTVEAVDVTTDQV